MGSRFFYIGGGFHERSQSVVLVVGTVSDVCKLESAHEEAVTRIILNTIFSVKQDGATCVVLVNGTDVGIS